MDVRRDADVLPGNKILRRITDQLVSPDKKGDNKRSAKDNFIPFDFIHRRLQYFILVTPEHNAGVE
jgi:hypothetical protein